METSTSSREEWGTRIGFILAAVGSAVGLGNIWRFPFMVGKEGGASFLLIYLAFVALIGFPSILVEFTVGRRSKRNAINAFQKLGYPFWSFIGFVCVFTGFVILSYYSVVAGWTIQYTIDSLSGAYFDNPGKYFKGLSTGMGAVGLHAIFMAITVAIVALGVQKGIELCVKVLVPAIVLLLLGMIVYAMTLPGAMDGLSYYLSPDFEKLANNWGSIVPSAAGQAFFTLSLGMGAMITYSSYLGEDDNLLVDSCWIAGIDTTIACMTGLVIFPVMFSVGMEPGEGGAGALFISFGEALSGVPGSTIVGFLFFGTVFIAALSSAISILEVVVSFVIDQFEMNRMPATICVGACSFLAGLPTALNGTMLQLYDGVVATFLLPLGLGLIVLFVGWFFKEARDEITKGLEQDSESWFPLTWLWHVRIVILLTVSYVIFLSGKDAYGQLFKVLDTLKDKFF